MALRITAAYDTLCHGGICHGGESSMSTSLFTLWQSKISNALSNAFGLRPHCLETYHLSLFYIIHVVTGSFTILSKPFDFYLPQCTKRPVHSPPLMVSDATVVIRSHAMIAIDIQRPEWHIFPADWLGCKKKCRSLWQIQKPMRHEDFFHVLFCFLSPMNLWQLFYGRKGSKHLLHF